MLLCIFLQDSIYRQSHQCYLKPTHNVVNKKMKMNLDLSLQFESPTSYRSSVIEEFGVFSLQFGSLISIDSYSRILTAIILHLS